MGRRPSRPPWTFVNETSNPERALASVLERDRIFTDQLRGEALRLGLRVIEVDLGTTEDEDDTAELVTSTLGL